MNMSAWLVRASALGIATLASSSALYAAPVAAGPQASAAEIRAARGALVLDVLRLDFRQSGGDKSGADLIVDLAPDILHIRQADQDDVIDFGLRRHFRLDARKQSFANTSLYADVAFRVIEASNRLTLGKVLGDMGAEKDKISMNASDVEAQLGIALPSFPKFAMDTKNEPDGTIRFLDGGKLLATVQYGSTRLSEDERKSFAHFLRHGVVLSPPVVDAILADGHLPVTLSYSRYDGPNATLVTLTLNSAEHASADYPLPSNYVRASPDSAGSDSADLKTLYPLMFDAVAGRAGSGPRSIAGYRQVIQTALDSGNTLQAVVNFMELSEQYGPSVARCTTDPAPACRSQNDSLRDAGNDPQVQVLTQALGFGGRDAAKGVPLLRSIDRKHLSNPYLIDLFLANDLGNSTEARPLFVNAIRGNPYVPGFYKDFGDYLYRQFDTWDAWMFYDLARNLPGASNAPLAGDVDTLETRLSTDFPEFF